MKTRINIMLSDRDLERLDVLTEANRATLDQRREGRERVGRSAMVRKLVDDAWLFTPTPALVTAQKAVDDA